jgi:hypothetical protein
LEKEIEKKNIETYTTTSLGACQTIVDDVMLSLPKSTNELPYLEKQIVATPLLEECEDDIHIPEMGTWESFGTPETSEFDCRGQNTSA